MGLMTAESPCVIQMIKDVRAIYDAQEDGSGRSDGISIIFDADTEKFHVMQEYSYAVPESDGVIYIDSDVMWEEKYSWNEMTMWCFNNRQFTLAEFRIHNAEKLASFFMKVKDETSMEDFTKYAYYNPEYVPGVGKTHGELGHKLF